MVVSIRVSLLSRCDSTSVCAGSATKKKRQQPGPAGVASVVSLMHSPSGILPGFWSDLGGTAYGLTVSTLWLKLSAGLPLSDWVFVNDQTMRSEETPVPLASSAASELIKYS